MMQSLEEGLDNFDAKLLESMATQLGKLWMSNAISELEIDKFRSEFVTSASTIATFGDVKHVFT